MDIENKYLEKLAKLYQDTLDVLEKEESYYNRIYLDGVLDVLYVLGLEEKVRGFKK